MKQSQRVLSTYAADLFGACSALYELGGLIVMHDASGCNSTYSTHDEPRWYDAPAMVYISGLREADTIFGDDRRLVASIKEAAEETRPAFIAIGGSPMPNVIGTDYTAIARIIEKQTQIPTLGIRTDGIHSYISGAGAAFKQLAERFVLPPKRQRHNTGKRTVNLLGVTPLDFSVTGSATALKKAVTENGMIVKSCWAMGDNLENMQHAAEADVNAVVSTTGLPLAEYLEEKYQIPYVVDLPVGSYGIKRWIRELSEVEPSMVRDKDELASIKNWKSDHSNDNRIYDYLIIGEPTAARAIAKQITYSIPNKTIRIVCPVPDVPKSQLNGIDVITVENGLRKACSNAKNIICDPIYKKLLPNASNSFIDWPHEAYSGRIYRGKNPVLIGKNGDKFLEKNIFERNNI